MLENWTRTSVLRKLVDVYYPARKPAPRFGVLFLHGVGGETLTDNEVYSRLFEELGLVCVSPHGQRCWWVDRVCPEFDPVLTPEKFLLQGVLPLFQEKWNLQPRSIGVMGISMGGQGALRLAFKYPQLFPVVAGISSALDYHDLYGEGSVLDEMYDSKEQCRQDTALMHVPPFQPPPHIFFSIDPEDVDWIRSNDRLHEKLSALGVEHTCDLTTRAGGHSWTYFNHMAEPVLRFLYAGLELESRRLL